MRGLKFFITLFAILASSTSMGHSNWPAEDVSVITLSPQYSLMLIGAFVVMFMQAGFAIIEGRTDFKSRTFIKFLINYVAAFIGNILFFILSYAFFIHDTVSSFSLDIPIQNWYWNIIIFYVLMSTTITMIVGRIIPSNISLLQYWWIALFISGVVFSSMGYWVWGGFFDSSGLLKKIGFIDFAGATVVHSMSAWMVLAGYIVLEKKQQRVMQAQTILMSDYKLLSIAVAAFILWLAWSGLNIGYLSSYRVDIQVVVANTVAALIASVLAMMLLLLCTSNKISFEHLVRASVGGLVAITASCGLVSFPVALFVGAVSGLVVYSMSILLRRVIKATNVVDVLVIHGLCGVWGTFALLFSSHPTLLENGSATLVVQLTGIVVGFIWAFGLGLMLFKLINRLSLAKEIKQSAARHSEIFNFTPRSESSENHTASINDYTIGTKKIRTAAVKKAT